MRAEITRAQLGKAITNLRKIQDQRKLRLLHNSTPGIWVEKVHFFEVNLELEPVAALALIGPLPASANQLMGSRLEVKIGLRTS